jgi:hypothetical protein
MRKPRDESERGFLATETSAMMQSARRAGSATAGAMRDLMAMGEFVHEGGKEMAAATLIARSQDWQLKPMMEALETLSKVTNWDHSWMVAQKVDGSPSFDWRNAPSRRYASFQDFYNKELAATSGEWDRLVETWRRVCKGEISDGEAQAEVRLSAETREAIGIAKLHPLGSHGKRLTRDLVYHKHGSTGAIYLCRRLARDHPAIFAALERGTYRSIYEAAIAAGVVKKVLANNQLARLRYDWKRATPEQRALFLAEIGAAMKD